MSKHLKNIHLIQIELALEVKRICEKYDIKYALIAGTLLGAVRHKGFIPWDDDLDVGMTRENYERFLKVAQKDLGYNYFIQTWETDPGFALPIAKMRKNDTEFVEMSTQYIDIHHGVYIDIFPFDNVPSNMIKRSLHCMSTYVLKRILMSKKKYVLWNEKQLFKKFFYKFFYGCIYLIHPAIIKNILLKFMTFFNNQVSAEVVNIGGAYGYRKETIKREWIENLSLIEFEKHKFLAPLNYNEYLSYFYGDYMTLPPTEKRGNRHNIIRIKI
ncbi:MAG TPA: LicD family protein [Ignavibacteria bacterium]|nr:LicD family protein [Ignavibacteria bacterium]